MLVVAFNRSKLGLRALAFALLLSFASCATEKKPEPLVSDPNAKAESTLPWNKQEKWEQTQGLPSNFGQTR
jgi:hypothetical protein